MKRSQQKAMWAMLHDIEQQCRWPVNGEMRELIDEEWKDIFTASLDGEMRMCPTTDGRGVVMLGFRTRDADDAVVTNLLTLMRAFGDARDVRWSDPMSLPVSFRPTIARAA